jgi:hypothetical protein
MSRPPNPSRLADVLSALLRAAAEAGWLVQGVEVDRNGKIKLVGDAPGGAMTVVSESKKPFVL